MGSNSVPETVVHPSPAPLYPLTQTQQEIWFNQILHEGLPLYNIGAKIHLPGAVDIARFREAVRLLVLKHDCLRIQLTQSRDENGVPQQTIVQPFEPEVILHDFREEADPLIAATQWMQRRFMEPFVLDGFPLFRYDLVRVAEADYYWLMQYHHLITDGWGSSLLVRSLGGLYTALVRGETPDLWSPSYLDFIANEQEYRRSERYRKHGEFWKGQFTYPPEPLLIPKSGSHLPAPSDCRSPQVPRALIQRLETLAKAYQGSFFHVLIAVLALYFSRTRGVDTLVIGLPMQNRSSVQFKQTAGLFTWVFPFSLRVDLRESFDVFLQRIAKQLLQCYRYQRYPISAIYHDIRPVTAHRQLFDIVLSYERQDYDTSFGEIVSYTEGMLNDAEQIPLVLAFRDYYVHSDARWDFVTNRAYFDDQQRAAIQSHLLHLLEAVAKQPRRTLDRISLVPESEVTQLHAWGQGPCTVPLQQTVVGLFEAQAAGRPEAPAVEFGERRLSYRELNEAANRVAHGLMARGVGSDVLVGLVCARSIELIVGLLGILKAGGAYVPIDSDYPQARIEYLLEDSGARILLTQRGLRDRIPQGEGVEALCLDGTEEWPASVENPVSRAGLDDLAYVIYTSGSTGRPKGVMLPHGALANLIAYSRQQPGLGEAYRTLQQTSLSFDVSLQEIFSTFDTGGCLVLIDEATRRDSQLLCGYLEAHRIERLFLPYAGLMQLTETAAKTPPSSLVAVITAGEQLRITPSIQQFFSALPYCHFWNHYGPSETHVVTAYALEGIPDGWANFPPIGRPIANTQIYVLDPQGQPVPIGVPGELYIGGMGLARGYLNRPELTAERFVELEVFGQRQRLYRTGDRVHWREDGQLLFLGRLDHQIKLRGYRIELGEIEATLVSLSGIKECVVMVREDHPDERRLVAYVVLDQESDPIGPDLRGALAEQLPDYMIPVAIVPLDSLPLTPNGKLDRAALPAPEIDRAALGTAYVAPRNPIEETLAELWQEILMLNELPGIHDNFFDLGGHSLLSARLVSRIKTGFGLALSLRDFFQSPTIANLAELLKQPANGDGIGEAEQHLRPGVRRLLDPVIWHQLQSYAMSWQGERASPESLIVGRNLEGTRPPLFWVFQGQEEFAQLGHYLGVDQPLYGMRSGHLVMDYTEDNIQALALDYVREIQALRPCGALVLGGNCQGTLITMAIAQHLMRRERYVLLLILMEWTFSAQPYAGPVGLIFGRESDVTNPYRHFRQPELMWQRAWPRHRVEFIPGAYGELFREPNVQSLAGVVSRLIDDAQNIPLNLLPAEGRKATIAVDEPPLRMWPGERRLIVVRVTNTSPLSWPGGRELGLFLVNQWCKGDGKPLMLKDGGIPLPALASGEETVQWLPICAPKTSEALQLRLKVVEEGVFTWLRHDYEPLQLSVQIAPNTEATVASVAQLGNQYSPPILIGGTGGSGTRVISRILQQLGVHLGTQLNPSDDSIELLGEWWARLLPYWKAEPPIEIESAIVHALGAKLAVFLDGVAKHSQWGWKLPPTVFFAPFWHRLWPGMRCIHVVRDGRDMALSHNQKQLNYLGPVVLQSDELLLDKAQRSIRLWDRLNLRLAEYAEAKMPGQYLRIRYEDLCAQPRVEIERLMKFLGLEGDAEALAKQVQPSPGIGRWRQQAKDWLIQVEHAGREGLARFDYLDGGKPVDGIPSLPAQSDLYDAGLIAFQRGEYDRAIEQLNPALDRVNRLLPALAESFHRQHRYDEAERAWRQALALNQNDGRLWLGLALSCQAIGNSNEAVNAYKTACERGLMRPVEALTPLFELAQSAHEGIAEVAALVNRALKQTPQDTELLALVAQVQLQSNEPDAVVATVHKLIALRPDQFAPVVQIIWKMVGRGMLAEAKLLITDLVERLPNEPAVLRLLVHYTLHIDHDVKKTLSLCDAVLKRAPHRFVFYGYKGECLAELGELDHALAAFDRAIEGLGDRVPARFLAKRGQLQQRLGVFDKAREDLLRAIEINPDAKWIRDALR
ncbi:amino acid adenylation domain-containing protein [Methylomagnum ishizawai]|uniref:Amino acid adenylation domain-containing protein n=1 Tax=Methylomagnum ishizawai TaxID=1760988 RepID=A0A1Y6D355_9GAMM|nr:amino acid adenylation domain-containing protein [Methylomagnum ishizawai]